MSLIPFDDREGLIWFDNAFIPWREAKLHVLTHALHYGSAVFEGERMYEGRIFALEAHTDRFFRSAELLDFAIPYTKAEISRASSEVCARNGLSDCYVRPIAWRGAEHLSVSALHAKVHVAIAAWAWPKYFDEAKRARGVRLDWAQYRRPSTDAAPAAAKAAGLYMICTISKNIAERAGYEDALMLDSDGNIAETTGANVFFARDGALHTPLADCFLDGITRQTVIALARSCAIPVTERRIQPSELASFTECFIVGTAAELTPVQSIGEFKFTPGALTATLTERYERLVRAPAETRRPANSSELEGVQ